MEHAKTRIEAADSGIGRNVQFEWDSRPEKYLSIVHQLPDILYKLDDQGRFVYLNNSIRNLGYEPGDLLDKHFSVIIHPEDRARVQRKNVTARKHSAVRGKASKSGFFDERRTGNRITRNLPVRFQPGEGGMMSGNGKICKKNFHIISTGVYDYQDKAAGKIFTGTVGIMREIVRHKGVAGEHGGLLGLYRTIVEHASDLISIVAGNGTILYCSPSSARVLGREPESMVGNTIWEYVHEEDAPMIVDIFKKACDDHPELECKCRIRDDDGEWRVIKNRGTVLRDRQGKILCVVILSSDITTQHVAEESMKRAMCYMERHVLDRSAELQRTKKQLTSEIKSREVRDAEYNDLQSCYRNLVDKIDEIIFDLDVNGTVITVNSAVKEKAGFLADEMSGRNISEYIHEDDIRIVKKLFEEVRGRPADNAAVVHAEREIRIVRKDRTILWIDARCRQATGAVGKMRGYILMAVDITRKKMSECDNTRIVAMDVLAMFAAGLGRDLNNILTSVMSNISLVKLSLREDDAAYSCASLAVGDAIMAREIAWKMMEISGGGSSEVRSVSLEDLIRKTASVVVEGSAVFCRFIVRGRIKHVAVNPEQMRQVINNIILNACQAMRRRGELIVTLENYKITINDDPYLVPGDYVRVSIADNGLGISPENIERVFDPVYTTKGEVRGLGLAVSYSIMKKHRGHISVKSTKGQGTEVVLYLPVSNKPQSRRQT
jgi:PAS domain S-box-containing protein